MSDVVLGMGEVGETLFSLLEEREISCVGIDSDESRCRNFVKDSIADSEYLHVCLPGELPDFEKTIVMWTAKIKGLKAIIIHSTIRPGTSKKIQERFEIPVLYSPTRGVHRRFLKDIKRYSKFVSSEKDIKPKIKLDFEQRFEKVEWMSNTKTAELAKVLVDTTYYGWLISYAQITKMICEKEGVDFDEMWKFADEIHENLGNRPKMYPGIIGGHCVIPNLNLIDCEDLDVINRINLAYTNFEKNSQASKV